MIKIIDLETQGPDDILDVTEAVEDYLAETGIGTGMIQLLCPEASTAVSIFTETSPKDKAEYLKKINHIFPKYDGMMFTGFSTPAVKSSLVGKSTTVTVCGEHLLLGYNQRLFFFDFEGPGAARKLILTAQGTPLGRDEVQGLPAEMRDLIAAAEEDERLKKEEEQRVIQEMRDEYAREHSVSAKIEEDKNAKE